jgi:hypothetical protein
MSNETPSLFEFGFPADVTRSLDLYRQRETQVFASRLEAIDKGIGRRPDAELDALRWRTLASLFGWVAERPKRIERRLLRAGLAPEPELTARHRQADEQELIQTFAEVLTGIGTSPMTRAKIAETAGTTVRQVANWQTGFCGPRIEHLLALAREYDEVWSFLATAAGRACPGCRDSRRDAA